MNLDYYLNLAIEAASLASKAIMQTRDSLEIWKKEDKSLVSTADMVSNEIITQKLSQTNFKIFSEEKILKYEERKNLEYFWLIDPLDGTSGFLKKSDEFCVMISLIKEQRPILALIQSPSTNNVFYAHLHTPVYKNNTILKKDENLINQNKNTALLSVNHLSKEDENFAKKHNLKTLNIGSGLKFCAILEGRAGVYKRNENLSIWDIAAGDFLINQIGGFMGDFNSKLLNYNQESYKALPFIALSDKKFLKDFL